MTAAALGTSLLTLETLDGPRPVDLRPGTQSGQTVTLPGRGVTHLRGGGRGDLIVHVDVADADQARPGAGGAAAQARRGCAARTAPRSGTVTSARPHVLLPAARRLQRALTLSWASVRAHREHSVSAPVFVLERRRPAGRRDRRARRPRGSSCRDGAAAGRRASASSSPTAAAVGRRARCCAPGADLLEVDDRPRRHDAAAAAAARGRPGAAEGRPRRARRRDDDRGRCRRDRPVGRGAVRDQVGRRRGARRRWRGGARRRGSRPSSRAGPGSRGDARSRRPGTLLTLLGGGRAGGRPARGGRQPTGRGAACPRPATS